MNTLPRPSKAIKYFLDKMLVAQCVLYESSMKTLENSMVGAKNRKNTKCKGGMRKS